MYRRSRKPRQLIPVHYQLLAFLMSSMNAGAQMMPVSTETGISAGVRVRARVSTAIMKVPPREMQAGMSFLPEVQPMSLAMWGMRSPTQPTFPHTETTAAVIREDAAMTAMRHRLTSSPRDMASSVERVSMSSCHRIAYMTDTPTATGTAANRRVQ